MSGIQIVSIAVCGGLGAICRYGVSRWALQTFGDRLPYGTLVVNVLGCLAIGFVMQLGMDSEGLPKWLRTAIVAGFLGALTTFSAFGYETVQLLKQGSVWAAMGSVGANVVFGVLAVGLGMAAGRAFAP